MKKTIIKQLTNLSDFFVSGCCFGMSSEFKIPEKLRELFKKENLQNYSPNIDLKISLDEQNLQRETFSILAMLNLKYWCEDEKEKQELMAIYKKNDAKKEELIEKIRLR